MTSRVLDKSAALAHLRAVDPALARLIDLHGPPGLQPTRNTFRSLARAIVFQQLSGRAAETIFRRFVTLFPGRTFPRPADVLAVSRVRLLRVGLSRQKALYLRDLARHYARGKISGRELWRLADEDLVERLTQVKGIGRWSADMFLIFGLNRPDVLPVGDLGVRKGFQLRFGLESLPSADEMVTLAEPWRPYRTAASWYLWRSLEVEPPNEI